MQTETAAASSAPPYALPHLATVEKLAELFADAGKTQAAIRADIFRADDRRNSRGDLLPGNGLGRMGAIVRRGRKVLVDVPLYARWLRGEPCAN